MVEISISKDGDYGVPKLQKPVAMIHSPSKTFFLAIYLSKSTAGRASGLYVSKDKCCTESWNTKAAYTQPRLYFWSEGKTGIFRGLKYFDGCTCISHCELIRSAMYSRNTKRKISWRAISLFRHGSGMTLTMLQVEHVSLYFSRFFGYHCDSTQLFQVPWVYTV